MKVGIKIFVHHVAQVGEPQDIQLESTRIDHVLQQLESWCSGAHAACKIQIEGGTFATMQY